MRETSSATLFPGQAGSWELELASGEQGRAIRCRKAAEAGAPSQKSQNSPSETEESSQRSQPRGKHRRNFVDEDHLRRIFDYRGPRLDCTVC